MKLYRSSMFVPGNRAEWIQKAPKYGSDALMIDLEDAVRLIITLTYDQSRVPGPPHSVEAEEVTGTWPDSEIALEFEAIDSTPPKFREGGLESVMETIWRSPRA